jgi:CDP-diacylglycerol--serine O-phosphatidyltransferase
VNIKNNIPNFLTLANLFCGLMIIVFAAQLKFEVIIYWAIAALVFDFLDGTAARILNVSSKMGKELDSLADIVSFGAAPALVLFYYWQNIFTEGFFLYAPFAIALLAAYRLAKFNIEEQNNDYFKGLPTPALAFSCFVLPQIHNETPWVHSLIQDPSFIVIFSFMGSFFLVSSYKFFSLKIGSKNQKLNTIRIFYLLTCLLLIVWLHFFGAFLCLLFYIGLSLSIQNRIQ